MSCLLQQVCSYYIAVVYLLNKDKARFQKCQLVAKGCLEDIGDAVYSFILKFTVHKFLRQVVHDTGKKNRLVFRKGRENELKG